MKNQDPLVSVVLVGRKDTPGWKASRSSIDQQSYSNYEVVEREVALPALRLSFARNLAYQDTAGEFLLFVNAGDVLDKTFLEKAIRTAQYYPANTLVGVYSLAAGAAVHPDITLEGMLWRNQFFIETLIPRVLFEMVGGFRILNTETSYDSVVEEWDFWVRALRAGMVPVQINEYLLAPADPERLNRTRVYASMFQRRNADLFNALFELIPLEEATPPPLSFGGRVKNYLKEIFA